LKDLVLLAVSFYLLKQDLMRLLSSSRDAEIAPSRLRADAIAAFGTVKEGH